MSSVDKIKWAMSLRDPQYEALQYFDAISSKIEYRTSSKAEAEKIASENCQAPHTISVDKEFDFPSFCFDMTTGIGKSRLMGACIYYLYKTKGYKHFFILAPGNTIYDKMRREAVPGHPKYMFKGLEAEMGRPKVYDGENYLSYPIRYIQEEMVVEKTSDIQIFIFNISKIFTRGDIEFKFHKFNENLGGSFADVLRSFDDLVICMDEAHRYYAPASKKAINYLNPVLGLEYTATPKSTNKNIIYHYGLEDGAGKFLKIPVVMGRTNTAGYSDDDIEEMKLKDGIKLHERRKSIVYKYCIDNQLEQVKPMSRVMTVAEKYVWCVKHRMEAAFASQLQYNDYGQGIRYISDYYEIDDFTNTYQDYVNSRHTKMEDKWIHTDQMVVTPYEEFSIENIEKWMKQADVPDFAAWFDRKTDTEILYAFTNIVNELLGIEEAVWISSGIVKRDGFQKFIEALDVYAEDRAELLNVSDFHSYIETSGFYTPQEICAVQTAKETNDIINIGEQENNVQVYKLITTCLSAHNEDTEMSFYLPSGIARKITGITYGDGYEYINENNEVIYKFSDVDKDWKNQQVCLQVNTSILESALKENSYKLFWVFRVYRSPSNKAYELYGNQICHDTDRSFVVWFDEEECKYIELKEIKPIRPNTYDDYELNIKILYGDAED